MSQIKNYKEEIGETSGEMIQLNELNYNCTECSSPIEIISINEKECSIEFKCINNKHKLKMSIKDYIDKMKSFNNKKINDDICEIHNKKYECYCINCNKHLCNKCLITREHIGHNKYIIIENKPNIKELNIIENIIRYYQNKIELLENKKIIITKDLNNKLKKNKDKLIELKKSKINENQLDMEKELELKKMII